MRICQITAIFIVDTVRISQRPELSFVSGYTLYTLCTLYNSTIFLGLEIYFLGLGCIYKEIAELEANNIFIRVLFEL